MKPNVELDLCTDLTVTWKPEDALELRIRSPQGLVMMSKMEAERLLFFIQDRLEDK